MGTNEFIDYYELLQLSPNADTETIERIFRHLAKKFHPDNTDFSDNDHFVQIVEAHRTLADPVTRAAYDVRYQNYWNRKWRIVSEASDGATLGDDQLTRERLLSLLYVQRRRSMKSPGLGEHEMARLLGTPPELVEFHLWYLKAKGWVERLETGHLAITALGVDQAEQDRLLLSPDRLIEAPDPANEDAKDGGTRDMEPLVSGD
jgi:hypothetical protein